MRQKARKAVFDQGLVVAPVAHFSGAGADFCAAGFVFQFFGQVLVLQAFALVLDVSLHIVERAQERRRGDAIRGRRAGHGQRPAGLRAKTKPATERASASVATPVAEFDPVVAFLRQTSEIEVEPSSFWK